MTVSWRTVFFRMIPQKSCQQKHQNTANTWNGLRNVSSMASLPYSVKSYKGQQKQKQLFFCIFFCKHIVLIVIHFYCFRVQQPKIVRLINVLSRYLFIPYQRLFCLTFKNWWLTSLSGWSNFKHKLAIAIHIVFMYFYLFILSFNYTACFGALMFL